VHRKELAMKISGWRVTKMYLADLVRWPILALFGSATFVIFFIFNRTRVIGRHHVPHGRNVIYACRHLTLVDSFPVTLAAMRLRDFFCPWLLPWHTADKANYMKTRLMAIWGWCMKIQPIAHSRIDPGALRAMSRLARYGRLFVFPGGTRERPNKPITPRIGIGHVAYETGATIVPVWIDGMEKVFPLGEERFHNGKDILIAFGQPVDYSDLIANADQTDPRTVKRAIADRATRAIYSLGAGLGGNPPIEAFQRS